MNFIFLVMHNFMHCIHLYIFYGCAGEHMCTSMYIHAWYVYMWACYVSSRATKFNESKLGGNNDT